MTVESPPAIRTGGCRTGASTCADRFSAAVQTALRLKGVMTAVCLCLCVVAAPLRGEEPRNPAARIDAEAPELPVRTRVGQTFTLRLRSNPTTGHLWKMADPPGGGIVEFISREYEAEKTGRVGSGGTEVWIFRAVGAGEARIALKYIRPWEKDAAPANTARFRIIVGGDGKGKGTGP